jgi:DNA (cytosine-5)-methyltransferase 1
MTKNEEIVHASLFAGFGGFDLAAEWVGWKNLLHCEWNPFARRLLEYYWSEAISYGDITKTDFTIHRGQVDVLSGGFPCQPFSVAGLRKGAEDERHLWPEMLRAVREIQPGWVVGENVRGLVSWDGGLVFEQVQAQLEAEGYEVQAFILPACGVNAPHRRERVWFVAHAEINRNRGKLPELESQNGQERQS